jgi:hypothetical protein
MQQEVHASFEAQYQAEASIPSCPDRELCLRQAERNRRYKWMWRREALRFWEPPELAVSATLGE